MEENQKHPVIELRFEKGDYVNTQINGYGYIIDILKNEANDRYAICVEFTYNWPNPRGFDTLIIEPGKMHGVDKWETVDKEKFADEIRNKVMELASKVIARIDRDK